MRRATARLGPEVLVTVVALATFGWRVGVPSAWRDEGATWLAAGRPLPALFALTRRLDLVHLPYYLLVHVLLAVDGGLTAPRWLSVLAMALAAGGLVGIGRRLGSVRLGVTAGLLLVAAPLASRYGQEARPYALAALAATVAAQALLAALDRGSARAWIADGVAVLTLGLTNVLALLVLLGQLPLVLLGQLPAALARRAAWRGWTAATAGGLVVLSPFLLATSRQDDQVSWLRRPGWDELRHVLAAPFAGWQLPAVLLVLAAVLAWRRPAGPGADAGRAALLLGAGWALLPPAVLWLVSQAHPLFDTRYLVAALPGLALALASLTTLAAPSARSIGLAVPVLLVAVLAVVGWPQQLRYRDPSSGHAEDARGASRILADRARPGDAVLFVPYHLRIVISMYPARTLPDDVALAAGPVASDTLSGIDLPADRIPDALAGLPRVWLVTGPTGLAGATGPDAAKADLLGRDYRPNWQQQVPHFTVTLYVRR